MSNDKGVHPGLVERAFQKSTWNSYTTRTSQQHAKAGKVEKETRAETLARDLGRLAEAKARRPLKPPGRR